MKVKDYIWAEKYRPKDMSELVISNEVRDAINKYIEDKQIPHLLLFGPPGSGKTTISYILVNQLKAKYIILNASSKDRGIETIKSTVTGFAKSATADNKLKIVILDEADGLTPDALEALKGTMESYSNNCRFILTANIVDRIIGPIQSRCTKFSFEQFPKNMMQRRAANVLIKEGIKFDRKNLSKIVDRLYPDFRSIINTLQVSSVSGELKPADMSGANLVIEDFDSAILDGDLRNIREMCSGIFNFMFLYKHLFNEFLYNSIDDKLKPEIAQTIASHLNQDSNVIDKEINFCDCIISIMLSLNLQIRF